MARFVLLYHDCPAAFRGHRTGSTTLEEGNTLRTCLAALPRQWQRTHARTAEAYPNAPAIAEADEVAAERLGDHRLEYLDFGGEIIITAAK